MGLFLWAMYVYTSPPPQDQYGRPSLATVHFVFSTTTWFEGRSFVQDTCQFSSRPGMQGTGEGVQAVYWLLHVYRMQWLDTEKCYQKVASGEYTGIWSGTTQGRKLPESGERWVHRHLVRDYTGAKIIRKWRAVSTQAFGQGLHRGENYQNVGHGEYTGIWKEKSHYFKERSRCCWLQTSENRNSNWQSVLVYGRSGCLKKGLAKMRTSWEKLRPPIVWKNSITQFKTHSCSKELNL